MSHVVRFKVVYERLSHLLTYLLADNYIIGLCNCSLFVAVIVDNFEDAWLEEKEFQREKKLKVLAYVSLCFP